MSSHGDDTVVIKYNQLYRGSMSLLEPPAHAKFTHIVASSVKLRFAYVAYTGVKKTG